MNRRGAPRFRRAPDGGPGTTPRRLTPPDHPLRPLPTAHRYDIALVGYGPVGSLLAALLGACGLRVLVLERETTPYALPRAAHLDDEALRVLQAAGADAATLAAARPLDGMDLVTDDGRLLLRLRKVGARAEPYGFPAATLIHQPTVEGALRARAEAHPTVEVRLGHAVGAVREEDGGATLAVQGPEGPYEVRAAWVVGCDGANSLVREAMGSPLVPVRRFAQRWLVVDATLRGSAGLDLPERLLQISSPRRPTTSVPFPDPRHRWEFMLRPDEDAEAMTTPETVRRLLAPHVDPDAVEVERAAVYTFRAVVAARWRRGRLLLAGDAAHQMPPFLGQGLGAGIRDAHNLAWKLALAARGMADAALLDTYGEERRPHVAAVTRLAVRAGRVIQLGGPLARLRDALLPALARAGPLLRLLTEQEHDIPRIPLACAGTPLPRRPLLPQPAVVTPDGACRRLDDVLEAGVPSGVPAGVPPGAPAGVALVGLGVSPRGWVQPADLGLWTRLATRAVHVVPPDAPWPAASRGERAVRDGGALVAWLGRSAAVLVVRPDRHLFGVYEAGEGGRAAAALQEALRLR
ncbi:MAG: bifunctional 3-(3-hydroxy-phenyl)propionate/3-hydroxycinnamic acid hydroxylase [Rubricoccaceae bacterium]|nr:bifunctional 3-(3-hydroxy-phenyl)propionate/3-hydroxycinnamic acid hydroxylase [Rubricoccaceae bacterium]